MKHCYMMWFFLSGVFVCAAISEDFVHTQNPAIDQPGYGNETPVQMSNSGFIWGGYCSGWDNRTESLQIQYSTRLSFRQGCGPGSYAYTLFDRTIALDRIIFTVERATSPRMLYLIVRTGPGMWYLSDQPVEIPAIESDSSVSFTVHVSEGTWTEVTNGSETLDPLAPADEAALTLGSSGVSIALHAVDGGGLYLHGDGGNVVSFWNIAWLSSSKPSDPNITPQGIQLWNRLNAIGQQDRFAFGHQDAILYGINSNPNNTIWTVQNNSNLDRSDVKSLTGRHPAVFGFDLALPDTPWLNLNGLKNRVRDAHRWGGIITFSWHRMKIQYNGTWVEPTLASVQPGGIHHEALLAHLDQLAVFFNDLRDDNGNPIPFILRPYHEYTGWFWWFVADNAQSRAQFINLFQLTIDRFRNAGCNSFLVTLSPCGHRLGKDRDFFFAYPGDDYVDIYGVDMYFAAGRDFEDQGGPLPIGQKNRLSLSQFWNAVNITAQAVLDKQGAGVEKLLAIAEFGAPEGIWNNPLITSITSATFFKNLFLDGLIANVPLENRKLITYALTWRNGSNTHGWTPVANHVGAQDFISFANDPRILLLTSDPVILAQPTSIACDVGEDVTFNIGVSSESPVSYQWFRSLDKKVDSSDVQLNQNTDELVLSSVDFDDESYYYCKIINDSGTVVSDFAGLAIKRLMAHWKLDMDKFVNNQYLDETGQHHAEPIGDPKFVLGINGHAVDIDADGGWAQAGTWDPSVLSGQFSASAWVRWNGVASNNGILSKRNTWDDSDMRWTLSIRDGGRVRFYTINKLNVFPADILPVSEWAMVTATYDGVRGSVYINGRLKRTANGSLNSGLDSPLIIGAVDPTPNSQNLPLNSTLDEVRIYNYALNEFEVAGIYYADSGTATCILEFDSTFDVSGPDDHPDCRVNFYDFAEFSENWLDKMEIADFVKFSEYWLSCGLYPICL